MRVVELVLRRIRDDQQMNKQIAASKAVAELVHLYNDLALGGGANSRGMYAVTGETYGSDFKSYIGFLPAGEQLKLLDRYLVMSPRAQVVAPPAEPDETVEAEAEEADVKPEAPAVRDARRHRFFVIKVVICFMLFLITIVVGATIAILAKSGSLDNTLIKSMMDTAAELAKILLSAK